jgi:beta-hydroxylase
MRWRVRERLSGLAEGSLPRVIGGYERLIRATPDGDRALFDPADFPWCRILERNWRAIEAELAALLPRVDRMPSFQDVDELQRTITTDDRWKTFFLYGYGVPAEANCRRCPTTARLVKDIPGMTTAMFSILQPGKHIPPHRGTFKGVLRYHLGLRIPRDETSCRLRLAGDYLHWRAGESLIFDDTYEHEVWNDSDEIRVVLFVDFLRPMQWPLSALNRAIVSGVRRSPYIQRALRNQAVWEDLYGHEFDAAST